MPFHQIETEELLIKISFLKMSEFQSDSLPKTIHKNPKANLVKIGELDLP